MGEFEALKSLYNENIPELQEKLQKFSECNVSSPLLVSPNADYLENENRLFVVGQQTYGWNRDKKTVNELLQEYKNFGLGKNYTKSPFWKFVRNLEKEICLKDYCSVCSNINRVDLDRGEPCGSILKVIQEFDFLLKKEIEILKPKYVVFLCGFKFDDRIKKIFPDLEIKDVEGVDTRQLAIYKSADLPFSIRTYHPKYLYMSKTFDKTFSKIITLIKETQK